MKRRRFGQFEMRREEPLHQQQSDVSAPLAAMHLLWWYTKRQEHVKTSNVEHCQDFLAFNSESSYVGKECDLNNI
jgi:hypothetical protein